VVDDDDDDIDDNMHLQLWLRHLIFVKCRDVFAVGYGAIKREHYVAKHDSSLSIFV
jgi:hypothetical protein